MSYNELKTHGTADFPIALYYLDEHAPKYNMAHHWHAATELIRVLSGKLTVYLNSSEYYAKPGDVIYVNCETVHGALPDNCVYECIVFQADNFLPQQSDCRAFLESAANGDIYVKEYNESSSPMAKSAAKLFESMRSAAGDCSRFFVLSALYELYGTIFSEHCYFSGNLPLSSAGKSMIKLKKVLSYIRSSFDTQISLTEMAAVCDMSPKYFCAFFRRMTKKSPLEYLTFYRIEKASGLLIKTDAQITDIAFSCGFNDLSYFIKTFRRITGQTPGEFRKGNSV